MVREILDEIARVRYDRPKTARPSPPRVCKKPVNKWQLDQSKRIASGSFNSIEGGGCASPIHDGSSEKVNVLPHPNPMSPVHTPC
jgi:hypothetical protein